MTLKVFEAFAGVGSQRMALRNIGIDHEVVGIAEVDKFAINSYMAIHGETYNVGDISKVDPKDIPDHDLFTYSFPCQDISTAGKQRGLSKGEGTRSSLLWYCEDIIKEKRPKYLMLENVKNLVSHKFMQDFSNWLRLLESYGYENYWKIINAKDYGIPQSRERVFVISILRELKQPYYFPQGQPLDKNLVDLLDDEVEEKYYMTDTQVKAMCESKFNIQRQRVQTSSICRTILAREYKGPASVIVDKPVWLYGRKSSKTDRFNQSYKVYSKYATSPTLLTGSGGGNLLFVVDNEKEMKKDEDKVIRKITPKEAWRLMGFSDTDYEKARAVNSDTQLYKQAGNSIVVPVLEALFTSLLKTTKQTE